MDALPNDSLSQGVSVMLVMFAVVKWVAVLLDPQ